MVSGNTEGLAKLRATYGPQICEACNRIFNDHSDDEMIACFHQIAAKNTALKKAAGEPIPPVDPDELRSSWEVRPTWTCGISPEAQAKFWAVSRRAGMIRMLTGRLHGHILAPWKHGEELDDAVFRIAATFPMRSIPHRTYHIAPDEYYGFDPNAFVQQLIEETGVSHTWEPIRTRVPEGICGFSFLRAGPPTPKDQASHIPFFRDEREAKRCTREVFWDAWEKYRNIEPSETISKDMHARIVATRFGGFVIDNLDLAQQLMAHFSAHEGNAFAIVTELERRAIRWMG
jgi:hypothetical protein